MADDRRKECGFCKKEIPESVALTVEGEDYINFFCSLGCYEHFFEKNPHLPKNEPTKKEG